MRIRIAVEDELSGNVMARVLHDVLNVPLDNLDVQNARGNANLERQFAKLNEAARRVPVVVLTDLDRNACAPALRRVWLPRGPAEKMVFRIAVREVEAWLLADRRGFADCLHVSPAKIPRDPEAEPDPKQSVINLARRSRRRSVREGVPPASDSRAPVGPDYNRLLSEFALEAWNLDIAASAAESLRRTVDALANARSRLIS